MAALVASKSPRKRQTGTKTTSVCRLRLGLTDSSWVIFGGLGKRPELEHPLLPRRRWTGPHRQVNKQRGRFKNHGLHRLTFLTCRIQSLVKVGEPNPTAAALPLVQDLVTVEGVVEVERQPRPELVRAKMVGTHTNALPRTPR